MSARFIIPVIIILITGCSDHNPGHFFTSDQQDYEDRTIIDSLVAIDSVNIFDTYDISIVATALKHNGTLYLSDPSEGNIIRIDAGHLHDYEVINIERGEGPGEIQSILDFDLSDTTMVIGDARQHKLILMNIDGKLIREISTTQWAPHRAAWIDSNVLAVLAPTSHQHVLHLISTEDGHLTSFGSAVEPPNPLKYEGYIHSDGEHLFYAGYAEPILKKYTVDGSLVYSKGTIDDFDTSANYVTFGVDSGDTAFTYTDWALFSTRHFDITERYWVVVPVPNEDYEGNHNVIDLYHISDGTYSHSFQLDRNLRYITIGASHIFGVVISENGEYYLVRYANVFDGDVPERVADG